MTLPAVHAIRAALPETEITLLARKNLAPLLERHPDFNRFLPWDPAQGQGWGAILRTAAWLKTHRFDGIVLFNPTRLFHAAGFLAGIPLRVGYRRKLGLLLNRTLADTKSQRSLHETEYNLELTRLLGIEPGLTPPSLPEATGPVRQEVDQLLRSKGLPSGGVVAIHPWTSNLTKAWPTESFWACCEKLGKHGIPTVVIGGEEEIPRLRAARPSLPAGVREVVGLTPLALLPELLRRCALLISNDSGPVHVAAAVGTPTLVVAPQSHEKLLARWRPLGPKHRILLDPSVEEAASAAEEGLTPCGS